MKIIIDDLNLKGAKLQFYVNQQEVAVQAAQNVWEINDVQESDEIKIKLRRLGGAVATISDCNTNSVVCIRSTALYRILTAAVLVISTVFWTIAIHHVGNVPISVSVPQWLEVLYVAICLVYILYVFLGNEKRYQVIRI